MITEIFAFLGAVGIAISVFIVIATLADKPVKALIVALMLLYSLFPIYLFILNKIAKRKEEEHVSK
jgi:Ca2+/Na+ antiporter